MRELQFQMEKFIEGETGKGTPIFYILVVSEGCIMIVYSNPTALLKFIERSPQFTI